MKLKHTKRLLIQVNDNDLDCFINNHYKKETWNKGGYAFVADQECGNDTSQTFRVKKEELDKYDLENVEKFKLDGWGGGWVTYSLLTDLCNKDLIEEGEYLIKVSW